MQREQTKTIYQAEIYVRRGIGMGPYGKGLTLQNESSARAVAMALQYWQFAPDLPQVAWSAAALRCRRNYV